MQVVAKSQNLLLAMGEICLMKMIIAATMSLIVACGGSKESSTSEPNPENKTETEEPSAGIIDQESLISTSILGVSYPLPSVDSSRNESLLSEMNAACLEATGNNLTNNLDCECPESDKGEKQIFNALEQKCTAPMYNPYRRPSPFETCQEKGFVKTLEEVGASDFNKACLGTVSTFFDYKESSESFQFSWIEVSSGKENSYENLLSLAEELDNVNGPFFADSWLAIKDKRSILHFKLGAEHKEKLSLKSILYPSLNLSDFVQAEYFQRDIYEPEPKNLFKLLASENITSEEADTLYPKTTNLELKYLDDAWRIKELEENFPIQWGIALYGQGCESLCRLFREPVKANGQNILMERVYSKGTLAIQRLWILDDKNALKGAVVYGLNDKPAYYIYFSSSLEDNKLAELVQVYDRRFELILEKSNDLLSNLSQAQKNHNQMMSYEDLEPGQGLILCEDVNIDDPSFFFKGDYGFDSSDMTGSIFGWQENVGADIYQAISGQVAMGIPGDHRPSDNKHGKDVLETLLSINPDLKVTASSTCFYDNSNVHAIAQSKAVTAKNEDQKIKVLNGSYGVQGQGEKGCKQRLDQALSLSKEKILLVLGAGNDPVDTPDSCPQSYKGFHSLIVAGVDAADSDTPTMWRSSAYGTDFADIAADYKSPSGVEGTSFAAPKVSAVAVKISQGYPTLTPEEIRLSILVSALIPEEKLPVRSGGVLRKDDALIVAKCFSDMKLDDPEKKSFTPEDAEICLISLPRFSSDKEKAREQVNYLKSQPLVFR